MTRFRPCIDLRNGRVTQIVGGSLEAVSGTQVNFETDQAPDWFAARFRADELNGGHVIQLGPGNEAAAQAALAAWPDGLQLGGGVTLDNAAAWLAAGARQVIVTSWLVTGSRIDAERAAALAETVGRDRVVIDLSCRRVGSGWLVSADRWQRLLDTPVNAATLTGLAPYCAEFLVHAADVEGLCQGIDEDLVRLLGEASPLPVTYAGGARSVDDLELVARLSSGRVDLTIGSALDIFGGHGARYVDCVAWNRQQSGRTPR